MPPMGENNTGEYMDGDDRLVVTARGDITNGNGYRDARPWALAFPEEEQRKRFREIITGDLNKLD